MTVYSELAGSPGQSGDGGLGAAPTSTGDPGLVLAPRQSQQQMCHPASVPQQEGRSSSTWHWQQHGLIRK